MKLVISQLKPGENPLELTSAKDPILQAVVTELTQDGLTPQGPIQFTGSLHQHEPDYYLQGQLSWQVTQQCSRCAEEFAASIQQQVQLALAHISSHKNPAEIASQLEEESEHLDVVYFQGNDLDLKPLLHEQFVLSLPFQALCNEQCKGLCQHCGKNLNRQECVCANQPQLNPFSVLKTVTV